MALGIHAGPDCVVLDGESLTLPDVIRVARGDARVELSRSAFDRMCDARAVIDEASEGEDLVYGVTTGVGAQKRARIGDGQAAYNRSMILSCRVGQGTPVPEDVTRATMLRLANGFAKATPGVRPVLVERLVAALNERNHPAIRTLGSIGQADLIPMADVAYDLAVEPGFALAAGEALALVNNSAFSTALGALAVADCDRLVESLDVSGALDLEAFRGSLAMVHPAVFETRPYPGLGVSLARIRRLLEGSSLWDVGAARNLQDPLSFRCLPQVHGAVRDALTHVKDQLAVELNASQGNPIVVLSERRVISVANFDVLPFAAAIDYLRVALASALTSASERLVKLLQAPLSGLPHGLSPRTGLVEDALSEFGVVGQALAAEARLLAHPVSFELVSTTQAEGIEDRMTMAPLAARRLADMVALGERLLAVELATAAQAIEIRATSRLGAGTRRALALVRDCVPFRREGEAVPALEPLRNLIRSGAFARELCG